MALVCMGATQAWASALTVNTTADSSDPAGSCGSGTCSLRDAINQASANDTINFSVAGTITLGSALPAIATNMSIQGPGANGLTISGAGSYSIFVVNGGTVHISGLTITKGVGSLSDSYLLGGGLLAQYGTVSVDQCTFLSNTAFGGGAIFSWVPLTVSNSTFLNNVQQGSYYGGAITAENSTVTILNSTFAYNHAAYGGAIGNTNATFTIRNSTFLNNEASAAGGALFSVTTNATTLENNIFADNNSVAVANNAGSTLNASYNVYWQNLAGDCSNCTSNTNAITADPRLLPLGYYGGTTETFLPQMGSAATCAANSADAVDANNNALTTDQRGFPLSTANCSNSGVDAGAVQTNYLTVTTLADSTNAGTDCTGGATCSLRDAIGLANTATSSNQGGGDISFESSLTSVSAPRTIPLASALPAITGVVNIDGPGANQLTVSGGNSTTVGHVFAVNSGATATVEGLTISHGNAQGTGNAGNGGGIVNQGTLTILNSAVSSNFAANNSGGVENGGGTLTVAGSTISANNAGAAGGGITNEAYGTLLMTGSTVFGNAVTSGSGGGISIANGTVTITNGTIAGNAQQDAILGMGGGGVYVGGTLTLSNSIVAGNTDASGMASNILNPYSGMGGNVVGGSSDSNTNLVGGSGAAITLSSLELNGAGATLETMIPLPGSAAICAGKSSNIPSGTTTDERGFPLSTPSYCTSGQLDAGAVQTNYTGVSFAVQPSDTAVNTAIAPSPAFEILETNTSTAASDTVAGVPITLDFSGGASLLAGGAASLTATTGATAIGGNTVNAAVYSLTPNTPGTGLTLAAGPAGAGIQVAAGTTLTATSSAFAVYGAAASLVVSATTPVTAGGVTSVTVTAVDSNGVTVLNNSDTVNLTLSGQSTILATVHLSGGTGSANVTLTGAGIVTLTAVDTLNNSISGVSNQITVAPAPTPVQVVVSGYPSSVYAGVPQTGTVTIEDQYNNVETGYSGNVDVTTSESATAIPVAITNGVGTFTTSFATAGANQAITAAISPLTSVPETGITVNPVPNYVVSTTADDASGVPANCPNGGGASCTLRDALAAAAATGAGNVTFSATVFSASNTAAQNTITMTGGSTLNIPAYTTITGAISGSGATLSNLVTVAGGGSSSNFSIFTVGSGVTATIKNLQLTNGNTSGNGGAINNGGTLTVTNSTISGNSVTNAGCGGAINNGGALSLVSSTIARNTVSGTSGWGGCGGAGIASSGSALEVIDSTISGNTASDASNAGGGIFLISGRLTVINSTISGNSATAGLGGGVYLVSGTTTVTNSTISGNSAASYADIYNNSGSTYNDGGGNLANTGSSGTSTIAPELAPLGNYGGPTQTMIPLPGSPAICAGSAANIPSGVVTDQRGEPNTNTNYAGYSAATPCVDAGAVQTNYSLAFTTPVSNVFAQATMSPAPAVTLDESGQPFAAAAVAIPLRLASSPSGATLGGGSATTSAGVATYSALSVSQAGTGDQLTATVALNTSPAVSISASSGTFDVTTITPVLAFTPLPATQVYGTPIGATSLDGVATYNSANILGSFAYTTTVNGILVTLTPGATVLPAGSYTIAAAFTPAVPSIYASASATALYSVTAATVTANVTAASKTYDGSNTARITACALSGVIAADSGNVTCAASGATFATANVGTGLSVRATGISLSGVAASKYTLASTTAATTANITPAPLAVTVNNASRIYGTANPAFTGTAKGLAGSDTAASVELAYSSAATAASAVGSYPITASITSTNYRIAVTTGTLTIAQAASSTTLQVSAGSITPGQSVTLTAMVKSATTGAPTGSVSFYDGTAVLNSTPVALAGGVATFSTTALAAGMAHSITATYSGDVNFAGSNSTSTVGSTVTVAPLDFTMNLSGPANLTVVPGQSISYQVQVTPDYGSYAGTVNFTMTGLPAGATATFSPASIPANGGPQTVTVTIATAATMAMLQRDHQPAAPGRRPAPIALGFLLLFGIGGLRKGGRKLRGVLCVLCVLMLAGGALLALGVSGCGGRAGFFAQAPHNYNVTVTAVAANLQHSATINLNVQ